jgi:hypothetical protein
MKRCAASALAVVLLGVSLGVVSAQSQPALPGSLGDNAALKYWLAFAMMPQLTPAEDEIAANWKDAPLDAKTASVVDKCGNALDLLQKASQTRRCDWGLIKEGPATVMPHLAKARQISRLACLRARYRVSKGDSEGAVKDLLAAFALSRHVNSDGVMISMLVRVAIEGMVIDTAAQNLKGMDREQVRRLAAGLETLPEKKGFREAMLSERDDMLGWIIADLKRRGIRAADDLYKMMETADDKPKERKPATQDTVNALARELDKAQGYYTQWAEAGSLPPAEYDRHFKRIENKMKKDCPLIAASLTPALGKVRYKEAAGEQHMAMLKAAIAVVLEGPDRLKAFKDPYGDGPFEYREIGNGFQLKCKSLYDDEQVALTVPGKP